MLEQSKRFAKRLKFEYPQENEKALIQRAFELALSRRPSDEESQALQLYAQKHGWENVCRIIFNLNEFSFVD